MNLLKTLFKYLILEWKKDGLRRLERKQAWYEHRGDTIMLRAVNYRIDRKVREIAELERWNN